jgi:RNA ligase (TIGR02306 family)
MNELLNEIEANEVTDRDNLAVIYRVERLESIPLKDRIELVHLKDCGYTTICEKGHQIGDLVVFIKYDTIVPKNELFEFMADFKYRVKSKSFTERDEFDNVVKKIYSQGIVLPLQKVIDFTAQRDCSSDPEYKSESINIDKLIQKTLWGEGDDFTKFLEIKKYIPPAIGSGSSFGEMRKKGDFPTHIVSKTDELNLASRIRALEELGGKPVYITQKIEGSSVTFYLDDATGELIVCSRNNMLTETETNKFWQAVNKYNMKEKLIQYPWLVFQAELYGPGIQKNKLGIPEVDIAIFNMVDKRNRKRLSYDEMDDISVELGVCLVPVVYFIESFDRDFDWLQELADIQEYKNGAVAEGIVVRPIVPFYSNVLKELWSVKVINREYKL